MEFLDISSLGATYRYVRQNQAEAQTKDTTIWAWEPHKNPGKGSPNPHNKGTRKYGQYQDN
jgi:hypothetical protein